MSRIEGALDFICESIDLTETDDNGNTYLVIDGFVYGENGQEHVRDRWFLHGAKKSKEENAKTIDWRRSDLKAIFGKEITSNDFQKMQGVKGKVRIAWKAQDGYADKMEIKAPYKEKLAEKSVAAVTWASLFGEEVRTDDNTPF